MNNLLDNNAIKAFLYGGLAVFTIKSKKTSTEFTFKIQKCPKELSYTKYPPYFVKFKDGKKFVFVGTLKTNKPDNTYYAHSWKKAYKYRFHPAIDAFKWLLRHIDSVPSDAEIYHIGRCSCCGRKLTTTKSIKIGIGPVCIKKLKEA